MSTPTQEQDPSLPDIDTLVAATPATAFTLVWALELALARVTGQIQSWGDMLASALILVALPLLAMHAVSRMSVAPLWQRTLAGVICGLPLAAVTAGIVVPIAARYAGPGAAFFLALLVGGLLVTNVLSARAGDGPAPSTGLTLGLLVAATATAWVLQPAGFPPFQVHLPFLVIAVLLARLAMRANGLPLIAMAGVAFALWPAMTPPPPWAGPGTANDRADVVLLTVEGAAADDVAGMKTFARLAAAGLTDEIAADATPGSLLAEVLAVPATDPALAADRERATLAERFVADGYDTAAIVAAAPDLDVQGGFHRGFAAFHHFIDRNRFALPRWRANLGTEPVRDYRARPVGADLLTWLGLTAPPAFAHPPDVLAVAAKFMSDRRDAPVFLWVHFIGDADAVDTNAGHILDGLAADKDRPRRVALLATPAAGDGATTVPIAFGHFGIDVAPAAQKPADPAAVTRLLLGL